MGSLSPLALPIIKFSQENLESGATRADIRRALEEFGCFEGVLDDKVILDLYKAMFGVMENLFDLPMETKTKDTCGKPYPGYLGNSPHNPLYESLGITDATRIEKVQIFTNVMLGEEKSTSSEIIHSYVMNISELMKLVKKLVLESFGVEKYCESLAKSTSYNLRLMKYRLPTIDETKLAAAAHTDINFCTILQQDDVDGLEVQTKDGEWFMVTPSSPSSFIFVVGNGFYAWTNGRVHLPLHRVMAKGNKVRYSMGVFASCNDTIKCPEELVDEEHPLLFKPYVQLDFIDFFHKNGVTSDKSVLKAFCGV